MSDRDRMASDPSPPLDHSAHEESLRYVVAGILSTISFTPSLTHPAEMLTISDLVIQTVRKMGTERGNTPMQPGESLH